MPTEQSSIAKSLLGAAGGAVVALVLYGAYSFTVPNLRAMVASAPEMDPIVLEEPSAVIVDTPETPIVSEPEQIALRASDFDISRSPAPARSVSSERLEQSVIHSAAPSLTNSGAREGALVVFTAFIATFLYLRKRQATFARE